MDNYIQSLKNVYPDSVLATMLITFILKNLSTKMFLASNKLSTVYEILYPRK